MKARQVIEEILSRVFKWHRFPVSLKAEAVFLYFKGLSLRAVREFLLHKGYEVSIEAIREWFHAVGRALQAVYTTAIWVYVDETKIKARLERSLIIISDSGGIQEEACTLKKPLLITRNVSERTEVVDVGLGKLVGTNKENIVREFENVYRNLEYYQKLTFENPTEMERQARG